MPTTLEFLQAVLPSQGQYCYTVIENKRARNYFVSDLETLAERILYTDARTTGAVYHACASYVGTGSRTQANVGYIKSFWLDVDVGEGKGYNSQENAIAHVALFCARYGLPVPTVVCSGSGLHIYWTLQQDIDRQTWEPIAQALKSACQAFGLAAGPERTADCASILRPPGSTHRKGNPRPVICGPLSLPSPLEVFSGLSTNNNGLVTNRVISSIPNRLAKFSSASNLLRDCLKVHAPEAINFDQLTDNCAQCRSFKDTGGNLPEPLWYALLGVLGFAYNGDAIGHEWSSGHANYSYEETQGRLDRAKELSGPTTCAHIKSLNPEGCAACKLLNPITPLEAGRRVIERLERAEVEEPFSEDEEETPVDAHLEGAAIEGHGEYQFRRGALYHITQNFNGAPAESKLSSFPVFISSVHVGEINQDQYYYNFRYYKKHNGWHDVVLKPSDVHGQFMMPTLANHGMVIHDPVKFYAYIKDSVDSLNEKRRAAMSYEQFGWKGDKFLYGNCLYGPTGPETAAVDPELKFRSQWLRPSPGGSVEGWRDAVDNLMGQGSEGMSLTVLASFASILMPFFGVDDGGAILNLMTRHTGAGKSTALAGAITVWASNKRALGLTNVDTTVSKASALGYLGNIPCVWDEFDNKDPDKTQEFVEIFTEGRDKTRGAGGGKITHTMATWRMLMLICSNKSIQGTIASIGGSEAPMMRVMELPIESAGNFKPSEALELEKKLYANAGWAGEKFLLYVVHPGHKEWITRRLHTLVDEIAAKGKFEKEHRFWVRALAAIACAAMIVERLEIISFSSSRIMDWAIGHFGNAGQSIKADPKSMLECLSDFLNANLGETLVMPGPAEGRKLFPPIGAVPKNRVSVRIENKGETCYIAQQPLRSWLEKNAGGGYSALIDELRKEGILKQETHFKVLTAGTEILGGQTKCLVFDIGHPKFNGMMREVKEQVRHDKKVERLLYK